LVTEARHEDEKATLTASTSSWQRRDNIKFCIFKTPFSLTKVAYQTPTTGNCKLLVASVRTTVLQKINMNLTISGYSTALFSTWYFVEELGLLLDCGEGVTSALLQKSRKIENVFISHADRDHLTGLLQFNQLNARQGLPIIHYPKDCGSFPAIKDFSIKFDPHVDGTLWKPIIDRDKVWIKKDIYVEAVKNNHVSSNQNTYKSLGYKVVHVKSKLKPEYVTLPANEIRNTIETLGKEATHTTIETILLCYSGDTPVENFEHWNNSKILIHEATFLGGEEDKNIQTHGNRHSKLEDVIKSVSEINIEQLILGHFSSRYSNEQIDNSITALCEKYRVSIPVYRLLPGQATKDILAAQPLFKTNATNIALAS
jgi:ribonuclease Z